MKYLNTLVATVGIISFVGPAAANSPQSNYKTVEVAAGTGVPGHTDGVASESVLNRPHGLTQDEAGMIYFADRGNHQIRAFNPQSGEVSTIAGSGIRGFAEGEASKAQFNQPVAVEVGSNGVIYVADRDNHMIRMISVTGDVSTIAGTGVAGYQDGQAAMSQFNEPYGVALDEDEKYLLVADYLNHAIRKIDLATGVVVTFAGNGIKGLTDGRGEEAQFNQPYSIIKDIRGHFLIPDQKNHAIRRLKKSGEVETIAGTGVVGDEDGLVATFNNPTGVAVSKTGTIYVADRNNHRIRKVNYFGYVSTLAGTGVDGDIDGPVDHAKFSKPLDLTIDQLSGDIIVSEDTGHKLRRIQ